MKQLGDGRQMVDDRSALVGTPLRELLRTATEAPHQRLHLHAGFAKVKDGTISFADYRTLLRRLYGFYRPFESALGLEDLRTQWLASDLAWLGADAATLARIKLCQDLPRYDRPERHLGALYVVEGAALGGRQLYRSLDGLFGAQSVGGRRYFAGRGDSTGQAWCGILDQIAAIRPEPSAAAALVGAAIETFERLESWLDGWRERQ